MWRRLWRVWGSLPQHCPCCRQLCRVGLWDAHTHQRVLQSLGTGRVWAREEPGHGQSLDMGRAWTWAELGHGQSLGMGRAWTWAEPCFNGTTLGGQILPGLPDQHQQRQHLHCCSAPESLHCCTVLSLQGQGARAGDMELPKCWVAPQMSSKWQRKCESGNRVEERENELSAQMSVKTELSPRAMKPFSLSHSKQGAIFSSAAPSCLGWAAGSLTTLAAEKGCPDVGWDVAACLLQL